MLVNIEAWNNVLVKDTNGFTKLDHYLLKKIIGSHSKAPTELTHLETAALPIKFILASRRINYLHNILVKKDHELTKRVYECQIKNPSKGDWCNLVRNDMAMIGLDVSDGDICGKTSQEFKTIVKTHVKAAAFNALKCLQDQQLNISNIVNLKSKIT